MMTSIFMDGSGTFPQKLLFAEPALERDAILIFFPNCLAGDSKPTRKKLLKTQPGNQTRRASATGTRGNIEENSLSLIRKAPFSLSVTVPSS